MRSFPFRYQSRLLKISVVAVDEAWELWVSEHERRIAYGGRVSMDQAIEGWRRGEDRIQALAEEVKSHILTGKLVVGPQVQPEPAPESEAEPAPESEREPANARTGAH
jgi:hypothetical protein